MINKAVIRDIGVLTVPNQPQLLAFLLHQGELKTGRLVAINAEKVIATEQDQWLKTILQKADYPYADGISIVYSIRQKYPHYADIERIAGVELWETLLMASRQAQIPVFLVGSEPQTLVKTAEKLRQLGVNIVGTQDGYFNEADSEKIVKQIQQSGARLVTVAMGSPRQEKWIDFAYQCYPEALYMGVGGSYDVFVGKVKRAPKIWQNLGLEWLYRLLQQPTRWQRQLRLLKYAYYYFTKQL